MWRVPFLRISSARGLLVVVEVVLSAWGCGQICSTGPGWPCPWMRLQYSGSTRIWRILKGVFSSFLEWEEKTFLKGLDERKRGLCIFAETSSSMTDSMNSQSGNGGGVHRWKGSVGRVY